MKKNRSGATAVALAIGGFVLPTFALQPLVTDDTGIQGEAANQVEFSIDRERATQAGATTRARTVAFTFTRGVTDTLDAFFATSHVRSRSDFSHAGGNANPVLGVKWRFLEVGKTSLALKPEILFPVSAEREARGLGSGSTSWAVALIATREVRFGAIHANLATTRSRFRVPGTPASTTGLASVAALWDVAPGSKLAVDLGYEAERSGGFTTRSRFAGLGGIHSPTDSMDLALGVFHGRSSAHPRVMTTSATVGVTWRFR